MELSNPISDKAFMDKVIDDGIIKLINLFRKDYAQIEYEKELCYCFHDILVNKLCENNEFKIRWDYESMKPYKGKEPSANSKFYAKYDICLINENTEIVPYAFEFKFFKDLIFDNINVNNFYKSKFKGIIDDIIKLTNPDNKVESRYILVFAYGKISSSNISRIEQHKINYIYFKETYQDLVNIASTNNNVKIAFIYFGEIGGEKPIFDIFTYPNDFCASLSQKGDFS